MLLIFWYHDISGEGIGENGPTPVFHEPILRLATQQAMNRD